MDRNSDSMFNLLVDVKNRFSAAMEVSNIGSCPTIIDWSNCRPPWSICLGKSVGDEGVWKEETRRRGPIGGALTIVSICKRDTFIRNEKSITLIQLRSR